jgi:ketopantoate reductase
MKTLIVGAGVIGTIYGWALSEAGVDVTHLVRPGRADSSRDGVTLDVLDERKDHLKNNIAKYALKCVEQLSPDDPYDLIIVPTNSFQVEDALETLVPNAGDALFLIFSAVWEGTEFIDRLLPRDRYLLGYPDGGGTIRDGLYWTNLGAEVHLGLIGGQSAEKLEQVKALFVRADMKPDVQPDMLHWLWQHIAGTVGFSAGFAKDRDVDTYLGDKALLRESILSTFELYKLCELRGVNLKHFPETGFRSWPVWLIALFLKWNFRHNASMKRYTAHAASQGSLHEAKLNYYDMIETARQFNLDMPHTRNLETYLQNVS